MNKTDEQLIAEWLASNKPKRIQPPAPPKQVGRPKRQCKRTAKGYKAKGSRK